MQPVVIHDAADAIVALRAAHKAATPLIAFSPPGFACYAGVVLAAALWQHARRAAPAGAATYWVDCADDAAIVQEGLRVGLTHLVYAGPAEVLVKLADIATQTGATLRPDRPALTLDVRCATAEALDAWLARACA